MEDRVAALTGRLRAKQQALHRLENLPWGSRDRSDERDTLRAEIRDLEWAISEAKGLSLTGDGTARP